ncbi:SURF1 family cytochrome oxidase biogenesis protein [Sphingomonas sp.]|uniref:SURF1 family cytochrome oxidase biogenesis protein n=1 Tax=Sphingomonas sp. TaxID=28214 RepID=UPI002DD68C16|nr:SURF1 family cytochrome oxidase biogenesis protein [Sphingomonas sp.]
MTRRLPVIPTILVGLAVAAMIALGVWQLAVRLPEKQAELALLARNPTLPAIAFPGRADDALLFRRTTLDCHAPVTIASAGAGGAGYRLIATCAGGELVQLGTTRNPKLTIRWDGGLVSGRLSHAPDARPLIATLFDREPKTLLLVAETPPVGLTANGTPDWRSVPNNHLSYAVQWFLFAGIALVIYGLALRRRTTPSS